MTPHEQPTEPPAGRPPRGKLPLIVIGAIAVVAVVGAAVAYLLLSGGDDDRSDPKKVAQDAAAAYGNADVDALKKLSCDPSLITKEDLVSEEGGKMTLEVSGEPKVSGSNAEVPVTLKADVPQNAENKELGLPPSLTLKGTFKLIKRDDGWCVDGSKPLGPGT